MIPPTNTRAPATNTRTPADIVKRFLVVAREKLLNAGLRDILEADARPKIGDPEYKAWTTGFDKGVVIILEQLRENRQGVEDSDEYYDYLINDEPLLKDRLVELGDVYEAYLKKLQTQSDPFVGPSTSTFPDLAVESPGSEIVSLPTPTPAPGVTGAEARRRAILAAMNPKGVTLGDGVSAKTPLITPSTLSFGNSGLPPAVTISAASPTGSPVSTPTGLPASPLARSSPRPSARPTKAPKKSLLGIQPKNADLLSTDEGLNSSTSSAGSAVPAPTIGRTGLNVSVSSAGSSNVIVKRSADNYGQKCSVCGHTAIGPASHYTSTCINSKIDAVITPPVDVVVYYKKGKLFRKSDQLAICTEFNYYRWHGGECPGKGSCNGSHLCSLCHSDEHGAIDCTTYNYLPKIPSRAAPVPIGKVIFEDTQDQPFPVKPLRPNASVWSTELAVPGSTAYDEMNQRLEALHLQSKISTPRETEMNPAQCYPESVPHVVPVVTGYVCRLTPETIAGAFARMNPLQEGLSERVLAIFNAPLAPGIVLDTSAQRVRDESLHAALKDAEKVEADKGRIEVGELDFGLVKPFQFTDGCWDSASVGVLAHYPPPSSTPWALTEQKDGGALLRGGGLGPYALNRDSRFAYGNLLPRYLEPPTTGGVNLPMLPREGKAARGYPVSCERACVQWHAEEIVRRAKAGVSQTLALFGAGGGDLLREVFESAQADGLVVASAEVVSVLPQTWEMGLPCAELVALREEHGYKNRPVDVSRLFAIDASLSAKLKFVREKRAKRGDKGDIRIRVSLVYSPEKPNTGVVFLSCEHMTSATLPFSDYEQSATQDLVITFVEDLFFRRFASKAFPRPTWRFSQRKHLAKQGTNPLVRIMGSIQVLEQRISNNLGSPFTFKDDSLPLDLQKQLECVIVKVPPLGYKGQLYSAEQYTRVEWLANHRAGRQSRKISPAPPGDTRSTARVAALDANRPPKVAAGGAKGRPYPSVCLCGILRMSDDYANGTTFPLIMSRKTGAGRYHPEACVGRTSCWTNIPVDPDRLKGSYWQAKAGPVKLTDAQLQKCKDAVALYEQNRGRTVTCKRAQRDTYN